MRIDPHQPLLSPDEPALVIGLMSGTSADGVDAACCRLRHPEGEALEWTVLGTAVRPFDAEFSAALRRPSSIRVPDLAALHARLGACLAEAATAAAAAAGVPLEEVALIGSHGQTVWHDPRGIHRGTPTTLQIGSAAEIAERTGCAVWSDFRAADVAAGGEGAPLVPYVDWLLFRSSETWRVCLNLGGIANVTFLPPGVGGGDVRAFDTGPANVILDYLAQRLFGQPYDTDGATAASGAPDADRVEAALADPFFALPAPRSTGREWFDESWVERHFAPLDALAPDGVRERFASAAAITVESVARALEGQAATAPVPESAEVLVAGGGRRNRAVLEGLRRRLAPRTVVTVDERGMDGDFKEAVAFAVLGYESALGRATNLPSATGARHAARCGSLTFPPASG